MASGDNNGFTEPQQEDEVDLDALSPDFRAQLGLLDGDEGLTDAFKARIGLIDPKVSEVTEIEIALDEEREETISRFKFTDFMKEHFSNNNSFEFQKQTISEPLLRKKHDLDKQASIAIFLAIQVFMKDVTNINSITQREKVPIMTKIYRTLERHNRHKRGSEKGENSNKNQREDSYKIRKRSSWKKMVSAFSGGEKKPSIKEKSIDENSNLQQELNYTGTSAEILNRLPGHELDLSHYIIGHGILRKDLRDEIYSQICKQLTKNPSKESRDRGWMLLALCGGSFLPSESLVRHLRCFLKDAPSDQKEYSAYSRKILRRTATNGMRYHPPNWLEFQATKLRKYVMLPVTFSDNKVETLEADSATTASEMCAKIANKVGLKDQFGFSIYICIFDKVSSLGSGLDHVMDAISECEQVVRSKGQQEEDAPWRLYYRKELYAPWHDASYDEVATNLIYQQIMRGIKSEEYRFKSDEDLARYISRQYFIEFGNPLTAGRVQEQLSAYLPESKLQLSQEVGNRTKDQWVQLIITQYEAQGLNTTTRNALNVKEEIVTNAPKRWPLQFSGLFEAFRTSGPVLPKNDVVIAVGGHGLFVLDEPYKVVIAMRYYEIVEANCSRSGKNRGQSVSIMTVKGEEFTFISPNAETIASLVNMFLDGLRRRSKVSVALQEFTIAGEGVRETFQFSQGDVIELLEEEIPSNQKRDDWCFGRHLRSGKKGPFPYSCVYILPALEEPPKEFLQLFTLMRQQDASTLPRKRGAVVVSQATIGRHGLHGKQTEA